MADSKAPSSHDSQDSHGHGLAHTTPVWLLVGILLALLFLTVVTVGVTALDFGADGNLIIAMVIATIKAGLVVTFFMHLAWDKRFNALAFAAGVLFLILFLAMVVADRGEYKPYVDRYGEKYPFKLK
ncbi:MAG: cytochrome C oxidase subunit IV family protein [Polyangiaceae bacterium]|nr:cytochrome C oxidase subunit IV family protein [Polyangiaceae bacterium]